jgi:hypothetical protein
LLWRPVLLQFNRYDPLQIPVPRAHEREQADYQAKLATRDEKQQRTGKKPRGPPPAPPSGGVKAQEQINLTDEDSRIMPVPGGGFDQSLWRDDLGEAARRSRWRSVNAAIRS